MTLTPGSPEWGRTITASKIPTILGLDKYMTPAELWMRMTGHTDWEQLEGDHLDWGHDAEDSLVKYWLRKHPGWQAGRGEVAYNDPDHHLPFPVQVTIDRRARRGRRRHIIECKTSDSKAIWGDGLPAHVAAQVMAQMGVSGIHEASVVAQLRSTVPEIYPVDWDPQIWDGMVDVIDAFYRSLGNAEPPIPPQDLIDALTPPPVSSDTVEIDSQEATDLLVMLAERRTLDAKIEAEMESLTRAYGAEKIKCDGALLVTTPPRRFSKDRLPDEVRHLAQDNAYYTETTTRQFNAKAFQNDHPDIYQLGMPATTHIIGKDYQ